jgi:hypothetical protein
VVVNITQASSYNGNPVVESYSRQKVNGTLQPFAGARDPMELYARLFGSFTPPPTGGGTTPSPVSQLVLKEKSVLDVIDRGAAGLLGKLSPMDRSRVEEHFAQLRNLEKGLSATPPNASPTLACGKPTPPMALTPPSTQGFGGWANETYRGQMGADILAMAFACDLTRSVLWMITRDQSWLGSQEISGIASDFHAMGHDRGKAASIQDGCFKNCSWVAGLWGRFVDNLSKIPEGNGTVLDNTFTTLMFSEGTSAHGHEPNHIPFAGMPSKLKIGQQIVVPSGAHDANLLIAGMQAIGMTGTTTLGEISGPLTAMLK